MDAINQPLLDVRDLSVAFGNTLAVDHVSFSVKRGECVALVGESGSGKSVSALSILKLLPYPSASHPSGHIRFRGRELLTAAESEMREIRGNDISMIFQEPMTSLNPVMTVGKQIAEALLLHEGLSRAAAQRKAVEMLRLVRIPEPEQDVCDGVHRNVHERSGTVRSEPKRSRRHVHLTCHCFAIAAFQPDECAWQTCDRRSSNAFEPGHRLASCAKLHD